MSKPVSSVLSDAKLLSQVQKNKLLIAVAKEQSKESWWYLWHRRFNE